MVTVNRIFSLWKLWNKWYILYMSWSFLLSMVWMIIVYRQMSNLSTTSWREQVTFHEMLMMSALYYINTISLIFIVLDHWNNSPWVDMLHHPTHYPDSGPNSLLFLRLKAACLEEKQQISMLFTLIWLYRGSNTRSTALLVIMQI